MIYIDDTQEIFGALKVLSDCAPQKVTSGTPTQVIKMESELQAKQVVLVAHSRRTLPNLRNYRSPEIQWKQVRFRTTSALFALGGTNAFLKIALPWDLMLKIYSKQKSKSKTVLGEL